MTPQLLIHGYRFELTCYACPEQYDVYDSVGNMVAYCRLRHGIFRVHCPDYGGTIVYEASTLGDGVFDSSERMKHLYQATEHIQTWIINSAHSNVTDLE